jgi:diadenosine tetraphosphate (Ap4A) HIT family hydrolase
MFNLDPVLQKDTYYLRDLNLCQLLLMNNAYYPWLVLVPSRNNVFEITDLSSKDLMQLAVEMQEAAHVMQQLYKPYKLNIATIGNRIRQLHIHIVARSQTDLTWPEPVWGSNKPLQQYGKEALKSVAARILEEFNLRYNF